MPFRLLDKKHECSPAYWQSATQSNSTKLLCEPRKIFSIN